MIWLNRVLVSVGRFYMQWGKKSRDVYLLGLLLVVVLVGVIFMPREEYMADPRAIRCETISFLNTGSLEVPAELVRQFGGDKGKYFVENPDNHKWYSKYGIFNDVVSVPPLILEKIIKSGTLFYVVDPANNIRVLLLNLYNVLFSVGIAIYLYFIVGRYSSSKVIAVIFVLTSLYCTYWWNYLRAQNSEIYQTLFMLGFYYHVTRIFHRQKADPKSDKRNLGLAGIFLGMLILVKTLFVILIPPCALAFLFFEYRRQNPKGDLMTRFVALARLLLWMAIPVAAACCILLMVDWYKFGSPFESGYGQWQDRNMPIFAGDPWAGASLLLFDVQGCVFLYYPILALALFGYPQFIRRWPVDSLLILAMAALIFLLNIKMGNVLGWWGYGPRYELTMLPLLSIPFIQILVMTGNHWRKWWVKGGAVAVALLLLGSLQLQANVNALSFFSYFNLLAPFTAMHDPIVDNYFKNRTIGMINGDLMAYKKGKPWLPLESIAPRFAPRGLDNVKAYIEKHTPSNYYWWP